MHILFTYNYEITFFYSLFWSKATTFLVINLYLLLKVSQNFLLIINQKDSIKDYLDLM
jgi:hypothetical protein